MLNGHGPLKRLARDESGAELIEFGLVLPILLGLLWTFFQAYQLVSLKGAVHAAVAQAARYVTTYGALAASRDELRNLRDPNLVLPDPPGAQQIKDNVDQIIANALGRFPGVVVEPLAWYLVTNRLDPSWEGNTELIADPVAWLDSLRCEDPYPQFALRLTVRIPWRWVIFGYSAEPPPETGQILDVVEYAQGTITCFPRCNCSMLRASVEDCSTMYIEWQFDRCSYRPNIITIEIGGQCWDVVTIDQLEGNVTIGVPRGSYDYRVTAWSGTHEACYLVDEYSCPLPTPVPGP